MARVPNATCNRCGKTTYRATPKYGSEYRCQACRRDEPQATKSLEHRHVRVGRARRQAVCAHCASPFASIQGGTGWTKYCSRDCYYKANGINARPVLICIECTQSFRLQSKSAGKFCSRECAITHRRKTATPKPVRAKSTRVSFGQCKKCGEWICVKGSTPRRICGKCKALLLAERVNRIAVPPSAECHWCESVFKPRFHRQKWCSRRCRKTASGARSDLQRARYHGVAYVHVDRNKIYERDGWMCGICGDGIDRAAAWPDQMCASLDHIVPMAEGGPHQPDNCQAAHWLCNSIKSDRMVA